LNYRHGLPNLVGYPLPYVLRGYYRQHRHHSRFALTPSTLRYLAKRRITAAKCKRMGMNRLQPGVWYDRLADVLYALTAAPAGSQWEY
jgi:hypothetical protein